MITEVVEYIVKQLTEKPEAVKIAEREDGDVTVIDVTVDPADMGRVIGKGGRVAQSIRSIVRSISSKERKRYVVKFVETVNN